jgi:hypothetical protein
MATSRTLPDCLLTSPLIYLIEQMAAGGCRRSAVVPKV